MKELKLKSKKNKSLKQYNIFGDIDEMELIDDEYIIKTKTMEKVKRQLSHNLINDVII